MLYSVVIPCYKSSESIRMVVESTAEELERLGRTPYEFVLVDDCSPDEGKTLAALKALYEDHDYVKVIALARNGGQHNAIMAALNYAEGDAIIQIRMKHKDYMTTVRSVLTFAKGLSVAII